MCSLICVQFRYLDGSGTHWSTDYAVEFDKSVRLHGRDNLVKPFAVYTRSAHAVRDGRDLFIDQSNWMGGHLSEADVSVEIGKCDDHDIDLMLQAIKNLDCEHCLENALDQDIYEHLEERSECHEVRTLAVASAH